MVRNILFRAPARVELLQPAIKIPQVPLRFCPFWNARAVLAEQDGQYIGDRALLDHEAAVHVSFAKPQLRIEQDAPFGCAGGKPNRDGFAGAIAKDNLRSARGRKQEGSAADKGLEQKLKQPVHRTASLIMPRPTSGLPNLLQKREPQSHGRDSLSCQTKQGGAGWLSHFCVRRIVVMFHDVRLLMTAVYADEYLVVRIKFAVGRLN